MFRPWRAVQLLQVLAVSSAILAAATSPLTAADEAPALKKIAAIVTVYHHNSHADMFATRLLLTDSLDGKGRTPRLKLVSVYADQVPKNDISRNLAQEHNFSTYDKIADALTLGTGKLAVDGILLIAEHGDYPESKTGQFVYPKRRFFEQIVQVFKDSDRVVPVFSDKHLADNWEDAKWIYDTAREMKIPLMAGSSLPTAWRDPQVDLRRGAKPKQFVGVSYHRLDSYGFHALETLQCVAERRMGGETGVKQVQCLTGPAVWEAEDKGVYDAALLRAALGRQKDVPVAKDADLRKRTKQPVLWVIDYADGTRGCILTLDGVAREWTIAWRNEDDSIESTLFAVQEARPFFHFAMQLEGIEQMMLTGQPAWPVERTLLTSGLLDRLLISKQTSQVLPTPELMIRYENPRDWKQPRPAPPNRAIAGQ